MKVKLDSEEKFHPVFIQIFKTCFSIGLMAAVASCGSIAKGITEAILEQKEEKSESACHVKGRAFEGINSYLDKQTQPADQTTLKILMVHGIGSHIPGYSARLQTNLMRSLSLTVSQEKYKDISLWGDAAQQKKLGNLRIYRYYDTLRTKSAYFYELTWSDITEKDKQLLNFDETGEQTLYRTGINGEMKKFFNSHVADPLFYVGNHREAIQTAVTKSLCWVYNKNWDGLTDNVSQNCDPALLKLSTIQNTDLSIITHSLGSQISIDALQLLAERVASLSQAEQSLKKVSQALKNKQFPIYMLANQLPLLQLGVEAPKISNKISEYCTPNGLHYADRIIDKTSIYAFSDPNDLLSYAIEPSFADHRIDSRICPTVTNINIEVAKKIDLFGLAEVANPAEAHTNYDADERVINLIAHGIGTARQSDIVAKQCVWDEVIANDTSEILASTGHSPVAAVQ